VEERREEREEKQTVSYNQLKAQEPRNSVREISRPCINSE